MASMSEFDKAVEAFRSDPSLMNLKALDIAAAAVYRDHIGLSSNPSDSTTQGQLP